MQTTLRQRGKEQSAHLHCEVAAAAGQRPDLGTLTQQVRHRRVIAQRPHLIAAQTGSLSGCLLRACSAWSSRKCVLSLGSNLAFPQELLTGSAWVQLHCVTGVSQVRTPRPPGMSASALTCCMMRPSAACSAGLVAASGVGTLKSRTHDSASCGAPMNKGLISKT